MAARPTVGFITTAFPRYDGDHAGSFVRADAESWLQRGYHVEVVTPADGAQRHTWQPASMVVHRFHYARPRSCQRLFYGAGTPDNLEANPALYLLAPAACLAMFYRVTRLAHRWSRVVSHWALPSGFVASLLPANVPHLATFHGSDVHLLCALAPCVGRRVAGRIAHRAHRLRFVSHLCKTRFLSLLGPTARSRASSRSVVEAMPAHLPSSSECAHIAPWDRGALRAKLSLGRCTWLYLGRLVPIKGVDRAIVEVARRGDVDLIVAGDGPERGRLEHLARTLGAPVRFVGWLHGPHKTMYLRAADALVYCSRTLPNGRQDSSPVTLQEARAMGLPVRDLTGTLDPEHVTMFHPSS